MSSISAAHWDERYQGTVPPYGNDASPWLKQQEMNLPRNSRILLPADGDSRNGVWLAGQGHEVTSVDFSGEAIALGAARARRAGVDVQRIQADLMTWAWPVDRYHAVASIYLHVEPGERPRLHQRMADSLCPGGYLIIEGFHIDQLAHQSGGPRRRDMLWTADLLHRDFPSLEPCSLWEGDVCLDEGPYHQGRACLVRALFRRPPTEES